MPFILKLRDGRGYVRKGLFARSGWFHTPMKKMAAVFSAREDAIAFQTQHNLTELAEIKEEL